MSILSNGRHRRGDVLASEGEPTTPAPKSVRLLASFALAGIGGGSTFAIAYASIVKGSEPATTLLGTLATAALGALVLLAGGRKDD